MALLDFSQFGTDRPPPLPRPNPLRVVKPNALDFSMFGSEEAPSQPQTLDLSAFGDEAPPSEGTYLGEIGKGVARGATGMAGTAVSGLAALDPKEAYARDIANYREDLLRVPTMAPADLAALQERIGAEPSVITRRI